MVGTHIGRLVIISSLLTKVEMRSLLGVGVTDP